MTEKHTKHGEKVNRETQTLQNPNLEWNIPTCWEQELMEESSNYRYKMGQRPYDITKGIR